MSGVTDPVMELSEYSRKRVSLGREDGQSARLGRTLPMAPIGQMRPMGPRLVSLARDVLLIVGLAKCRHCRNWQVPG